MSTPAGADHHHDARDRDVDPFAPAGVAFTPVSSRLALGRLVSAGIVLLLVMIVIGIVPLLFGAPGWVWALEAVPVLLGLWLLWLVPRQVRAVGWAELVDDLVIRRGVMFRELVVVPYGRLQFVDVQAGPLDRLLGIARVQLHTASAASDAAVPGVPAADADLLRARLSARGEGRRAGL